FRAHHEFRFPLHGAVDVAGMHLELRQAIEPWHVLGEEPGGGGTVRLVDSSVERVEVKVRGMVTDRHVVACGACRSTPRGAPASTWRACAFAPGNHPRRSTQPSACTPRSSSTSSTPGR